VLAQNRTDTREWVQERRTRTRQLIELGGLVHKAGLVELLDDDRATLLGAIIELVDNSRQKGRRERMPYPSKHAGGEKECARSSPEQIQFSKRQTLSNADPTYVR